MRFYISYELESRSDYYSTGIALGGAGSVLFVDGVVGGAGVSGVPRASGKSRSGGAGRRKLQRKWRKKAVSKV